MYCTKCGKEISEGARFCSGCGNPVSGGTNYNSKKTNTSFRVGEFSFSEIMARGDEVKSPVAVEFVEAIKLFFLYALNFKGRSSRSEYWWSQLFWFLASFVLNFIPVIGFLASLCVMVPGVAVTVRRLHDIGKSGWYYFLNIIPVVGFIILIVFCCKEGQGEGNQWGPAM